MVKSNYGHQQSARTGNNLGRNKWQKLIPGKYQELELAI